MSANQAAPENGDQETPAAAERATRREQAARTRDLLLDAAAIEFQRRGVAGTRIEDVAVRAGVTRGALYFHFRTVENMAQEILSAQSSSWPALFDRAKGDGLRGVAAIQHQLGHVLEGVRDDPREAASLRIAEESNAREAQSAFFQGWQDALIPLLQQAMADGEIRDDLDIRITAQSLIEAAWGVLVVAQALRRADDLRTPLSATLMRLFDGISAHTIRASASS